MILAHCFDLRLISIYLLNPHLIPAPEFIVGVFVVDISEITDNR